MKYTSIFLLIFCFTASEILAQASQYKNLNKKELTRLIAKQKGYTSSNGIDIMVGDTLVIGKGSLSGSSFAYAYQNFDGFKNGDITTLDSSFSHELPIVSALDVIGGNNRSGFYVVAIFNTSHGDKCYMAIENAINSGELLNSKHYVKPDTSTFVNQGSESINSDSAKMDNSDSSFLDKGIDAQNVEQSNFTIGENGFKSGEQSYYVKLYPGMNKQTLYQNYLATIVSQFLSSDNYKINKIENGAIYIENTAPIDLPLITSATEVTFSMHYSLRFDFKDGKVKISAPVLFDNKLISPKMTVWINNNNADNLDRHSNKFIYLDGEENLHKIKKRVEDYFNTLLTDITNIKHKSDW